MPWCSCGKDNADGTIYNLVGFQTHLRWPEQKRVFSMIPALHNAEFLRYGVMHRNTYLDSPRLLDRYYRLKARAPHRLCRADDRRGGLCGVRRLRLSGGRGDWPGGCWDRPPMDFPQETAIGALALYVSNESRGAFPAHEHQFRHHAAPGPPGQGQAQQKRRAVPARRWPLSSRLDRRGGSGL